MTNTLEETVARAKGGQKKKESRRGESESTHEDAGAALIAASAACCCSFSSGTAVRESGDMGGDLAPLRLRGLFGPAPPIEIDPRPPPIEIEPRAEEIDPR